MMAIASLTINPFVRKNIPFDIAKDLAPISLVAKVPNLLVSHPSVPAQSIQELVAFAKTRPGKLSYASSGVGSTPHLGMELFAYTNGLKMVHVPYKGVGAAVVDVIAGHVPLMMANVLSALPHVRAGKLRAYGVTSLKRVAIAPEFQTIAEAGVPGFEVVPWFGLMAPANTPRDIIARLHAGAVHALQDPPTRERFVSEGAEAVGSTPEEFAAVIRDDLARWAKVTKAAGIKPE
ncbi:MAG: tripartite tricarboxylate transporter substrate binding protein [Betaproteobacteria bacterium]|nr:tripartite tricarboxylate transporter substrate binding protein [Betaproteobacteria bacterium]